VRDYGYRIVDEEAGVALGPWNDRRGIYLAY
jgi:hypothetical protein